LLGARGAAKAGPEDGFSTDTAGIWVIVRVRVEATDKTTRASYFALADKKNRTFRATARFKQRLADGTVVLEPGIPIEAEIAFETPRDTATGLTLRVRELDSAIFGEDLSAVTDIRVPVSDADVSRWLHDPAPASLATPKVVAS
jgi:hypothetical protein